MINKLGHGNINHILSVQQGIQDKTKNTITKNTTDFNTILKNNLDRQKLQFSKHADIRMASLGISKDRTLEAKLEDAVLKAKEKNIKEGLILTKDYGFVTSIKNNTVITVVNLNDMKDNVFTNIDGAVIL